MRLEQHGICLSACRLSLLEGAKVNRHKAQTDPDYTCLSHVATHDMVGYVTVTDGYPVEP